jgi:hypothetical protein
MIRRSEPRTIVSGIQQRAAEAVELLGHPRQHRLRGGVERDPVVLYGQVG